MASLFDTGTLTSEDALIRAKDIEKMNSADNEAIQN